MKGVSWALLLLLLCSCSDRSPLLPRSGGRPFEVLLAGDRDSTVYQELDADVEGLPQSEPSFDISSLQGEDIGQALRLSHLIVKVSINPQVFTATRIRYAKNVDAEPQMVVYIGSPSVQALKADMPKLGPQLRMLLNRAELNNQILRLREKHNIKMEEEIRRRFGIDLWIPVDMTSSKKGKDFLWLSNNATTGMQNICIYFGTNRDSVMKANIKGETDDMYMATVHESVRRTRERTKSGTRLITKGLWEMEGDAMGGPFISHTLDDSIRHRVITVEGFVYAPEMKKRNLMRQLEAVLYTLKVKE
ncbi:MAG TPA: DUF4837 domain-containing protein [Prevotella sp.]|nr:DUF4837 domain-containing protein [Prevotella sp.]